MTAKTKPTWWQNRIVNHGESPANSFLAHEMNARRHPARQREALRGSLDALGWVQPVLVSAKSGKVLDGHARIEEALSRDDAMMIPFVEVEVSEDEERLILATLDPISALATYDREALDGLLREVETGSAGIQQMLSELAEKNGLYFGEQKPVGAGGDEYDTTPDEEQTRVEYGDLWACGEHRVLCGDSTKAEDVGRVMQDGFDLLITSPPYTDQREYEIGDFNWHALMCGVFDCAVSHAKPDAHLVINLGVSHKNRRVDFYWIDWLKHCEASGWPLFGWYVWDKGSGMPGEWNGRLAPSHEFIFHFNRECHSANKWIETTGESAKRGTNGKRFRQKDGSLRELTSPDAVGQPFKVPDSVIRICREMARGIHTKNHPAVYPVALPEFAINTWTVAGAAVFDCFGGSGTTLIACERTGRKARLIEIEPKYVNVILSRYEAESGKAAQLLERRSLAETVKVET